MIMREEDLAKMSMNQYAFQGSEQKPTMGAPPRLDSWGHRSEGMKCCTCMWYVQKRTDDNQANTNPVGRCRRHAPTMSGYPTVFHNDWCGDHKLDENKL